MDTVSSLNSTNITRDDYAWYGHYAHPIFYALMLPLGFVGNILSIIVISLIERHRTSRRCIPDLLLGWLALVDLISVMVIHLPGLMTLALPAWRTPPPFCSLQAIIAGVYFSLEFFIQVSISVDRYLALVKPLQYRKRRITGKTVHITMSIASILSLALVSFIVLVPSTETTTLATWRLCIGHWDLSFVPHVVLLSVGACVFMFGFVVCLVCNASLVKILWRYNTARSNHLMREISDAMRVIKDGPVKQTDDRQLLIHCRQNQILSPNTSSTGQPTGASQDETKWTDDSRKCPPEMHSTTNKRPTNFSGREMARVDDQLDKNDVHIDTFKSQENNNQSNCNPPYTTSETEHVDTLLNDQKTAQKRQRRTLLMRPAAGSHVAIYLHEPTPAHTPENERHGIFDPQREISPQHQEGENTCDETTELNTNDGDNVELCANNDEQTHVSSVPSSRITSFQGYESDTGSEHLLVRGRDTPSPRDLQLTQFKHHVQKSLRMCQRSFQRQRQEILLVRLVIICTSVFVFTWTPFIIVLVLKWCGLAPSAVLQDLVLKMIFANAFLDPIFYGLCQGRFRKGYIYVSLLFCSKLTCGVVQKPGDDRVFYESKKKKVRQQMKATEFCRLNREQGRKRSGAHACQILQQALLVHRASASHSLDDRNRQAESTFQPSLALQRLFERYNTVEDESTTSSVDYDALAFMDFTMEDIYENIQRLWTMCSKSEIGEEMEGDTDIELDIDYDEINRCDSDVGVITGSADYPADDLDSSGMPKSNESSTHSQ